MFTKHANSEFREQIGPFLLTELSATGPAKGSEASLPRIIAKEKYTLLDFHLYFQVLIHIFEPKVYFIGLMALQEVMKSRRKTLSLSQQDLAEMAGIGLSTIKDIERGKGNPSMATVSKILEILGMEIVFKVRQTV